MVTTLKFHSANLLVEIFFAVLLGLTHLETRGRKARELKDCRVPSPHYSLVESVDLPSTDATGLSVTAVSSATPWSATARRTILFVP